MSFADIKAAARRAVHSTLAVPCLYAAPGGAAAVALTARLHTKIVVGGDMSGQGYSTIIEGVTRAVFNREELALNSVVLRRGGRVTFPDYNITLALDSRDAYDGVVTEKWTVASL